MTRPAPTDHPWRQYPTRRRDNAPTLREKRVAELMADGDVWEGGKPRPMSAREIAEQLGLSTSNVANVQVRIRRRINEAQRRAGFGDWC